jgi:hypothetical protein
MSKGMKFVIYCPLMGSRGFHGLHRFILVGVMLSGVALSIIFAKKTSPD